MKKAFSLVMVCSMVIGLVLGISINSAAFAASEKLYIYNWGDYIDKEVVSEFKDYYNQLNPGANLDVVYTTFETNEDMLTKITKENVQLDLICPSEYAIERLLRKGMLTKLDKTRIPNINNLDNRIYTKVDEVFTDIVINEEAVSLTDYFIPYMWGTLGVLYNTKVVTEKDLEEGWGIFWNKGDNPKLDNKIMLKDSIRDTYVAALLYLKQYDLLPEGYQTKSVQQLINTIDATLLEAVEEALIDQIKYLKEYEVDFGKAAMIKGDAYVDLAWSGDALWAMEDGGDDLDYFVPEIGGNVWFDGWVIPKNAQNSDAAYEFLNYLCMPEVAIRNSMEIGYTNSIDVDILRENVSVQSILEENEYNVNEYFDNELRYPDINDESLGVMKDFGSMNDQAVEMWERVKAKGSKMWILIVVIVGVVAVGGAITAFIVINKNNKGKRRLKK